MLNEIKIIQIENPDQDIAKIESNEDAIFIEVSNFTKARNIGLYLKRSNRLGTAEYPADKEPYIDITDILKVGLQNEGVYVLQNGNKVFFSRGKGSKVSNKIDLGLFAIGEKKIVKVGLDRINSISSRRFFVDLVAE